MGPCALYEENATPSTVSRMKRAKWKDLDTGPNTWLTPTESMAPARVNQPWCLSPFPSDSSFCPIITIHLILFPSHLPRSPVPNTNIVPFRFVLQYMLHTEMRILRKGDHSGPFPAFNPLGTSLHWGWKAGSAMTGTAVYSPLLRMHWLSLPTSLRRMSP